MALNLERWEVTNEIITQYDEDKYYKGDFVKEIMGFWLDLIKISEETLNKFACALDYATK